MKKVVIAGPTSASFGRKLAKKIKAPFASLIASHFPDGELKLRYPVDIKGKELIFVETMQPNPDEALIQLLFATASARVQGAKKVTLVIPYTGFLRQDKEFHRGEVVSNRIVAGLLSKANRVITMDPHLHRIKSLDDIFKTKTTTLTANNILADHIRKKHKGAIVVGPDEESYQWALSVAKLAKTKAIVLKKKRYTAEKVRIVVKSPFPLKGKHIVLVDDIISTGHTMIEPIKQFKQLKVKSITCIGVHGVFAKNALQKLKKLGAKVECTNTIENRASVIDVTSAFAKVL
ncbi:ribose-phosphate diphosphokinase [Candidatus Woesearchaeota archaeon]|nr:ribose-phosphate diphosphokinase [Candidatus Woesearchaeota archaeon]